ncbi:MAG: TatD family hydrolase [Hymenobacteraceae bacterium]|nr:TatD family hydrolase [Hymenobacteraceae bacterium]
MQLVDSHGHLFSAQFDADRAAAADRARATGVARVLLPNIDHTSIDALLDCEDRYPDLCRAMMGLHPCSVKKDFERELYVVEAWLKRRPWVALGETGLDLYWDKTTLGWQQEALRVQLQWAKQYRIPIVLHTRSAFAETAALVEEAQDGTLTGVFHCFSGSLTEAKQAIALGFQLGIGGTATFKNGGLDQVLPTLGLDHVMLETDCPYLAPVPFRGKRNEPAHLPLIAARVGELTGMTTEEVAEITTANAARLFSIFD